MQSRKSIVTAKFTEDVTVKNIEGRETTSEDKPFYEPSQAYYLKLQGKKPRGEVSRTAFAAELEDVLNYDKSDADDSSDSSYAAPPTNYASRRKTAFGGEIVKEFEKDNYSESEEEEEEDTKVKINLPKGYTRTKSQFKRRPTGFIKPSELPPIDDDDDDEGRVRIKDDPNAKQDPQKIKRRQTAFFAKNIFKLLEEEEEEDEEEEEEKHEEPPVPGGRRKTDFATDDDLEKIKVIDRQPQQELEEYEEYGEEFEYFEEIEYDKHVIIEPGAEKRKQRKIVRRPTGFVRLDEMPDSEIELLRRAVASRLDEDTQSTFNMQPPTLKNYRPITERIPLNLLLTFNQRKRMFVEEAAKLKKIKELDWRKPSAKSSSDKLPKLHSKPSAERLLKATASVETFHRASPSVDKLHRATASVEAFHKSSPSLEKLQKPSVQKFRKASIEVFSKTSFNKFRDASTLSIDGRKPGKQASKKDLRRTSVSENMMLTLEPISQYKRPVMTIETYRRVNEIHRRQLVEAEKAKLTEKVQQQRKTRRSPDRLPEIIIANKVYSLRRTSNAEVV